jgi:AcrR family transcriptional regulator
MTMSTSNQPDSTEQQPKTGEPALTEKAVRTRQRILEAALALFARKGYEGTTMREIAAEAGCSLGLAYRYFAGKDEMVLELYSELVRTLEQQVESLPAGSVADRFARVMGALLELMTPYRETLGTLFGAALNPRSTVGVFGERASTARRHARALYHRVVTQASDTPRPAQAEDLATLLYGLQLALVLFWLLDRTEGAKRTHALLAFLQGSLARLRPLLALSPVAGPVARLTRIVGPLLGDDRYAEQPSWQAGRPEVSE